MVNLGSLYGAGEGVKVDRKKARQLCQMAADRGDAVGQFQLAIDFNIDGSNGEALRNYRLSADQGFAAAEHSLGLIYMRGQLGVEVDYDEAFRWLELAASKGYEDAIESLKHIRVIHRGAKQGNEGCIAALGGDWETVNEHLARLNSQGP